MGFHLHLKLQPLRFAKKSQILTSGNSPLYPFFPMNFKKCLVRSDLASSSFIFFHFKCPGWPPFRPSAADSNQLKWSCVLQLIHDDNSLPGERLSCWAEKNGLKFAFAVCCHWNIERNTELALNWRICWWCLPGLLPKQKPQSLFSSLWKWDL